MELVVFSMIDNIPSRLVYFCEGLTSIVRSSLDSLASMVCRLTWVLALEVGSWLLGLKLCFQCNHVFRCRASKKDCTDHVQLALHIKYRNKGRKNAAHKNRQ